MAVPDKPLTEAEMRRSLLLAVDPARALGWKAEPPQAQFLSFADVDEALYGGARQGGKSDALLMFSIARRTAHPGSKGLILRRTLADLSKEGALIARSHELLTGIATYHTQEHKWRFPDGGVLEFSYCERNEDVYKYQGAQYDDICIDEAEHFTDWQFRMLRPAEATEAARPSCKSLRDAAPSSFAPCPR